MKPSGGGLHVRLMQTWHYGYVMLLLSEYVLATSDQSVMPGLRRIALEAAKGQSAVGSWAMVSRDPMDDSAVTG